MRRRLILGAGLVALLALTGCGGPAGVDGDLVDDWPSPGSPVAFVPTAGACHVEYSAVGHLATYNPVDCGQSHQVETLYVGTFTGPAAARVTAPPPGSAELRAAQLECDRQSATTLGGDWRHARLTVFVVLPPANAWESGARWFRCDASELDEISDPDLVARTASLVGALKPPSGLAHGCFEPLMAGDEIVDLHPVSCAARHRSEFAGAYDAPDTSYRLFDRDDKQVERGCLRLIARFAGVPDDGAVKYRTGWLSYYPTEEEWLSGHRQVRCFLWLDQAVTRSMKGVGTRGLPVQR